MTISRQKSVWIDKKDPRISYYLQPRARNINIRIDNANRSVKVTVPHSRLFLQDAKEFVRQKYDWILVQLEQLPPAQPFIDGGVIMYKGEDYTLHNPGGRGRPYADHENKTLIIPAPSDSFAARTKRFLTRQAREALENCTKVHAEKLGKTVDKISVRDQSSRWGSCVKRGKTNHISYSWRLICAPPFVLDYLCAHECAHLVHMNHSKDFWDLCDYLVGYVSEAEKWLKKNAPSLHAVGAEA